MAAPGSGIKFLGLDSALVDLSEKKSTLSNNKQEYFTASDIANGITAFDNGIVINETAADSDTRIEGQTDANLFFVDASTDRVGVGTNTPSTKFEVRDTQPIITVKATSSDARLYLDGATGQDSILQYREGGTVKWALLNDFSGASRKFRIVNYTSSTTSMCIIDSTDYVGIGQNTAAYQLDVNGDVNVASGSAYYHNGTAGLSGTYTFGGGTTGDIATMTFNGGILTAVTTVP